MTSEMDIQDHVVDAALAAQTYGVYCVEVWHGPDHYRCDRWIVSPTRPEKMVYGCVEDIPVYAHDNESDADDECRRQNMRAAIMAASDLKAAMGER